MRTVGLVGSLVLGAVFVQEGHVFVHLVKQIALGLVSIQIAIEATVELVGFLVVCQRSAKAGLARSTVQQVKVFAVVSAKIHKMIPPTVGRVEILVLHRGSAEQGLVHVPMALCNVVQAVLIPTPILRIVGAAVKLVVRVQSAQEACVFRLVQQAKRSVVVHV